MPKALGDLGQDCEEQVSSDLLDTWQQSCKKDMIRDSALASLRLLVMLHTNVSRLWWVGDIELKFTRDKPRPARAGQKPTLSIYGHVKACHAEQRRASPLRVNLEGTTSTRFAAYSLPISLFPGLATESSTHYLPTDLHYHPPAYQNLLIDR